MTSERKTEGMITALVPAFKSEHFLPLLASLAGQTVKAERVIISDDTEANIFLESILQNNQVRALLRRVNGTVIRGPKKGYHHNVRHLIAEYLKRPTEFFHILLDDDEIGPDFYSDHIRAHARHRAVCCVSRRYIYRSADKQINLLAIPDSIVERPSGIAQVSLDHMVQSLVVGGSWNWLGELSCMTLRREFLDIDTCFNSLDGVGLEGLNDVGTLLKSATVSDVIFLTKANGMFRVHGNSISTKRGYFFSLSILAELPLAIVLRRRGAIGRAAVLTVARRVTARWRDNYGSDAVHARLKGMVDTLSDDDEAFAESVLAFWARYKDLTTTSGRLSTREALMTFLSTCDLFGRHEEIAR